MMHNEERDEQAPVVIEAIDFKELCASFLPLIQNMSHLALMSPNDIGQVEDSFEVKFVRMLTNGDKQRFKITIEQLDEIVI